MFDRANFSRSGSSYTFIQYYNNIEVFGSTITVSVDNRGKLVSLRSYAVNNDIMDCGLDIIPKLTLDRIESILTEKYSGLPNHSISLIVYFAEYATNPTLAYYTIVSEDERMSKTIIIDANTGDIILEDYNSDYGVVTGSGRDEFNNLLNFPLLTVPSIVDPTKTSFIMTDVKRNIYIYDDNSPLPYIENTTSVWNDPVAVSTYTNVIKTYDWWLYNYSFKGINGKGGDVKVGINATWDTDNAMYNHFNKTITFCIKDELQKTKGALLDCVGHEYTHAVLHKKTNLALFKKARTINEAYADIFGSFINNNTWRTSSRDIANPNNTSNPSSIGGTYYDSKFKDEHTNSTIISHAAYLMENTYKFSFDKLHKLWYDSITEGYGLKSNFNTVRDNVITSAIKNRFTYDEIADIGKAFDTVGITEGIGDVKVIVKEGNDTPLANVKVTLMKYGFDVSGTTDNTGKVTIVGAKEGTNSVKIEISGYDPIYAQVLGKKIHWLLRILLLLPHRVILPGKNMTMRIMPTDMPR